MKQKRQRNSSGALMQQFTDQQFIDAVASEKFVSPSRCAVLINCKLSTAQKRLQALFREEKIGGMFQAGRWIYFKKQEVEP